nr:hypothetical protein Iba_chr15dCG7080 [Ipomoea batatas]
MALWSSGIAVALPSERSQPKKTVRGGRTEGSPGAASAAEARRYCRLLLCRRRFAVQTGEKAFAELRRHRKLTIAAVASSRRAATTAAGVLSSANRTEKGTPLTLPLLQPLNERKRVAGVLRPPRGGRTEGSPGAASAAEARRYCRLLLCRRRFAVQTGEKAFAELRRHRKLTIVAVASSRRAATTAAGVLSSTNRTEKGTPLTLPLLQPLDERKRVAGVLRPPRSTNQVVHVLAHAVDSSPVLGEWLSISPSCISDLL